MKGRNRNKGKPTPGVPGMAIMKEAAGPGHGFKKGGAVPEMMAEGGKSKGRSDRTPRKAAGGAVTNRGRSPYSAAAGAKPASGHGD